MKSLLADLYDQQRRLTQSVIESLCEEKQCALSVAHWEENNSKVLERYDAFIADLKSQESLDFPMLVVASRQVEAIAGV